MSSFELIKPYKPETRGRMAGVRSAKGQMAWELNHSREKRLKAALAAIDDQEEAELADGLTHIPEHYNIYSQDSLMSALDALL